MGVDVRGMLLVLGHRRGSYPARAGAKRPRASPSQADARTAAPRSSTRASNISERRSRGARSTADG